MFGVMGRLAEGVTAGDAEARLTPAAAILARARGVAAPPTVVVRPATGFGVPPGVQGTVMTLSGLVYVMMALLMAIACANVAALVLARGVGRTREIAVRLSLGASKLQIARQLLIESFTLAVMGCVAGSIVAFWLTQALVARLSTPFEYVSYAIDVQPDARVFAYAALVTAFAAILCGVAPIRYASRVDVLDVLKQSAARGRSRESRRALNAMVATQFAVSTALLAGAGMMLRAYHSSSTVQPGFETHGLVAATLDVDQIRTDPARLVALYDTILERLSAVPGVSAAGLTRDLPFGPGSNLASNATRLRGHQRRERRVGCVRRVECIAWAWYVESIAGVGDVGRKRGRVVDRRLAELLPDARIDHPSGPHVQRQRAAAAGGRGDRRDDGAAVVAERIAARTHVPHQSRRVRTYPGDRRRRQHARPARYQQRRAAETGVLSALRAPSDART